MKSIVVRLRIEPEYKAKLQEAVNNGIAKTMSDLIRLAVDKFVEESEEASVPAATSSAQDSTKRGESDNE